MRFEEQPWNAITARFAVIRSGAGTTGLSPTALIKRLSDGFYWNGATWQAGVTTVAMTEPDTTNEPGLYEAAVLLAQLDYTLGLKGYRIYIAETTTPIRESGFIKQEAVSWAELRTSYTTVGTFGEGVNVQTIVAAALETIADAILKRDMSAVTGEASRSLLNAARFLRNKWSIAAGILTVRKEDDTTTAWTAALTTDGAADPIVASDPT
jgi:hypothetical protein